MLIAPNTYIGPSRGRIFTAAEEPCSCG